MTRTRAARAQTAPDLEVPAWLARDLKRRAPWLTDSQDSGDLKILFHALQSNKRFRVRDIPFNDLKEEDFKPGQIIIAVKPGGTHMMVVSRYAEFWKQNPTDLQLLGNTGLPEYWPPHFILDQDDIGSSHNRHGPIYSRQWADHIDRSKGLVKGDNEPYLMYLLSLPGTNVYNAQNVLHLAKGDKIPVVMVIIELIDPEHPEPAQRTLPRRAAPTSSQEPYPPVPMPPVPMPPVPMPPVPMPPSPPAASSRARLSR